MADNNTIARPYAQALFEVAQKGDALDVLSESLGVAKEIMADGQVDALLGNPALSDDERLKFLQGLFSAAVGESSVFSGQSVHGANFLKLLLEYGRTSVLPEIADHFEVLKAEVDNSVDVTITSATAMSDAQKNDMVKALKARFGREINLSTDIDETLIGGAVIRAGDVVIDGSLRSRLTGLANALTA